MSSSIWTWTNALSVKLVQDTSGDILTNVKSNLFRQSKQGVLWTQSFFSYQHSQNMCHLTSVWLSIVRWRNSGEFLQKVVNFYRKNQVIFCNQSCSLALIQSGPDDLRDLSGLKPVSKSETHWRAKPLTLFRLLSVFWSLFCIVAAANEAIPTNRLICSNCGAESAL